MKNPPSQNTIGFTGALALIFITLKLCGVIGWSWWWVLSPILIPLCILAMILIGCTAILLGYIAWNAAKGIIYKFRRPR